ncbi:hypothetical protein CPB85DRAFT_1481534 [Mucidula mucida]|nr:hypothetical protein CPB85DRAFT_1481534 [Mucidula mucida]
MGGMTSTPPRPEHAESKIHFGRRVRRLSISLVSNREERNSGSQQRGGRSAEVTVALGPQRQLQTLPMVDGWGAKVAMAVAGTPIKQLFSQGKTKLNEAARERLIGSKAMIDSLIRAQEWVKALLVSKHSLTRSANNLVRYSGTISRQLARESGSAEEWRRKTIPNRSGDDSRDDG